MQVSCRKKEWEGAGQHKTQASCRREWGESEALSLGFILDLPLKMGSTVHERLFLAAGMILGGPTQKWW